MVNSHPPASDAVHVEQLNARKRKPSPTDEDDDEDDLSSVRAPRKSGRRLSIDVAAAAAAAAAASQCYRENSRSTVSSACSSPPSSSSSSSSSSTPSPSSRRPAKCLRLAELPQTTPTSPTEKLRRKRRRKELTSRRSFFRLYNKRITPPYALHAFRFPTSGLTYNAPAPSPAHTLDDPRSSPQSFSDFSSPFSSTASSSSSSPRPTPFSTGSSRGCLHQSCVAFRFASMIDGVHLSSLSPQRSSSNQSVERVGSFYVPPILPPINRYTLQELDLDAIMKNPQLRHDLLFDIGLQFRPTDSKRKRETSDMYWCAVKSELEAGCSCVSFDDMRHMHRHACHCATNARNADRKLKETCEHLPCEDSLPIHIPLRIGPLVEELREVVLAVVIPPSPPVPIRSGTPGTHPPNHVLRPRRLTVPEEASVAWLHEAFDVPLIEQQLRHGVFDPGKLLVAVGGLLREHCAPARDPMLDAMIGIAGKCGPGKEGRLVDALAAIRMCFELLEFMRLDLANHLLAHLRPHLLASAPQFEGAIFERRVDPDIPVTRAWLSKSYEKITSTPDLHNAVGAVLPPPNQLKSLSSVLKIVATVLPALVDLIVFPPIKTSATLPTSPTTTPVTKKQPTYQVSVQPGYPETLYLDHSRLLMLTADAADITASFMFLSMFRQFVYASPPKKGKRISVSDDELVQLKREIAAVGPPRPGVCFCKDHGLKDGTAQTENPNLSHWRNSMLSTVLHIAHTIENVRSGQTRSIGRDADGESSASFAPPDAELVDSVTNWCSTHMHADSAVSLVFRKKLAVALLKALIPRFFAFWNAGVQQRLGQNQSPFAVEDAPREPGAEDDSDGLKTKTGLEPLSEEIRVLAERLAKLAVLHLRVYFPFYDQGGFLPA